MVELLERLERELGREVFRPGQVSWLSIEDWDPSTLVSIDGGEAHLVYLKAVDPGRGSFRKLISGLVSSGFIPVVVEPTGVMEAIVGQYGGTLRVNCYREDEREEFVIEGGGDSDHQAKREGAAAPSP